MQAHCEGFGKGSPGKGALPGGFGGLEFELGLEQSCLGGGAAGCCAGLDPSVEGLEQFLLLGDGLLEEFFALPSRINFEVGLAYGGAYFPGGIDHAGSSSADQGMGGVEALTAFSGGFEAPVKVETVGARHPLRVRSDGLGGNGQGRVGAFAGGADGGQSLVVFGPRDGDIRVVLDGFCGEALQGPCLRCELPAGEPRCLRCRIQGLRSEGSAARSPQHQQ